MERNHVVNILYVILLLFCGTGWGLLLFEPKAAMENRVSLLGTVRAVLKQIWLEVPRREWIINKLKEKYSALKQPAVELEIYKSSILLKTLVLAEKDNLFSADYILERLMEHGRRLKPVYGEILTRYRSGRDREAFSVLEDFCQTRSAKNFSMVLSKLDQVPPDELTEQIEVFQEIMGQQRMTSEMKLVQHNSMMITALAACVMFVMMIDFTVCVVFMHTMTLLESIF